MDKKASPQTAWKSLWQSPEAIIIMFVYSSKVTKSWNFWEGNVCGQMGVVASNKC
jgi:hypothetical protein